MSPLAAAVTMVVTAASLVLGLGVEVEDVTARQLRAALQTEARIAVFWCKLRCCELYEYTEQLPELYLLPLASPPAPAADQIALIFNSITGHGLHNINSNLVTFSMSLFGMRALASGNNC